VSLYKYTYSGRYGPVALGYLSESPGNSTDHERPLVPSTGRRPLGQLTFNVEDGSFTSFQCFLSPCDLLLRVRVQ
jgi:hypothetical protein